jgi:hypothetical protein
MGTPMQETNIYALNFADQAIIPQDHYDTEYMCMKENLDEYEK